MKREFIPFEQALALRELGFNDKCFTWYWRDGELHEGLTLGNHRDQNGCVSAPLYQQAFQLFRERYDIDVHIYRYREGGWDYDIITDSKKEEDYGDEPFETFEYAQLACLIKLIEIVEQ